ncbi:energy-coupling factor transporter transmembrane protein EcfT [Sporosarcina sp. PTS2304]|uniref:energy-coupling factor transporter transmembrane component T n=1 Tax=Sporosarcina sp. PTS2304 TaxID=2283194 RepID=UPI000E0D51B7|nr:energy-coupling factor transporter transmembrane component T [Sporosarcina sp. PTS2304]AXI00853.1 energy-coupling factor transporter transmembrane protein EcfT [Sporosarcina sp. PTS2304]
MGNGIQTVHPFVMFFYYICIGFFAMFFNHPIFLFAGCLALIAVNLSHDGGAAMKQWAPMMIGMTVLIILINPFINSRGTHVFFYFRGKQVTLEATLYGVVTSMSLLMILLLFISLNIVLNGNKLLYIFSRILPKTAFLIMLSIRFVPLLKRRLMEIQDVQRLKGMTISQGSLRERARSGMSILQILLSWSLEEAIETADSMKARGYGSGKRKPYIPYRMTRSDKQWLTYLALLFTVCVAGGFLGYGKIIIYPALGTLHLYPLDWTVFACSLAVALFPVFVEGRELQKWNYST